MKKTYVNPDGDVIEFDSSVRTDLTLSGDNEYEGVTKIEDILE